MPDIVNRHKITKVCRPLICGPHDSQPTCKRGCGIKQTARGEWVWVNSGSGRSVDAVKGHGSLKVLGQTDIFFTPVPFRNSITNPWWLGRKLCSILKLVRVVAFRQQRLAIVRRGYSAETYRGSAQVNGFIVREGGGVPIASTHSALSRRQKIAEK
jgi:hypothetical protein